MMVCAVTAVLHSVHQACTIQKARRAKLSTLICRRPQMSVSFRCGDFVVARTKFWNDNNLFEVELLQHFLQLRKLSQAVCCAGLVYINWVDSCSRVDEDVTAGSYRINRLLVADDLVMLASSQQCLQHALDRFSAACDRAGTKISTKNTEVLCLSTNPRQCMLQVSGNTLQQVETFRHPGVAFASDGRWSEEIDTRIGKANAVLRELYRYVFTKQEFSNTSKLSVFKSVFVPILIYGHESCIMPERLLTQVKAAELGFLRRVHGVTTRVVPR